MTTVNLRATVSAPEADARRPLCMDLDGTLLATDLLWESILHYLRRKPYAVFFFPLWLLKGKAWFKRRIALEVNLDAAHLPYRKDVLAFLQQEKTTGRQIVLTTASDEVAVKPIVQHLGIFSAMFASDGVVNLSGINKCAVLEKRYGYQGFDYAGNSKTDLPLWRTAHSAILVNPTKTLLKTVCRGATVQHVFSRKTNDLLTMLRALRCYQWIKNGLIFVPLVTAHKLFDATLILQAFYAFLAFSLCASSMYIINDLLDLNNDRKHPKKCLRPFASGELSIPAGLLLSSLAFGIAAAIALLKLTIPFLFGLMFYAVITLSYSIFLKKVPVADVHILAGLYTLRVILGGVAVDVTISTWLLAFSMFIFLCLAFAKRYAELHVLQIANQETIPGRNYSNFDKEWMSNLGSASGYLSVLVFALYISSQDVTLLYRYPKILWLICPLMLFWVSRLWMTAGRGQLDDDPIMYTITDPLSYALGMLVIILLIAAV